MRDVAHETEGDRAPQPELPEVARGNIQTVAQIAQQFEEDRSHIDRLGAFMTRGAASAVFFATQLIAVGAWIGMNSGLIPDIVPFDPFPFPLLGVLVSLEAVFLAIFVLMAQKRQTQQAEHWAHLNLQVGLLAEQEATKMLQLLTAISNRLGVSTSEDAELKEMAEKTAVNHLHKELAENLRKK